MSISLEMYWKGRDKLFVTQLTPTIRRNAEETVRRANFLLEMFYSANPMAAKGRGCNSGWRPAQVNASTKGAAKNSPHMTAEAIDIGDDDEMLDKWLMTQAGQKALESVGLWIEHPSATPRWTHVQTRPPASGRRVFFP